MLPFFRQKLDQVSTLLMYSSGLHTRLTYNTSGVKKNTHLQKIFQHISNVCEYITDLDTEKDYTMLNLYGA